MSLFDRFSASEFSFEVSKERYTYWQKHQLNDDSVVDQEYLATTSLLAAWEHFENSPMSTPAWHMFDGTDGSQWNVDEEIVGYLMPMIAATRKARIKTGDAYQAAKSPALIPIGTEFLPNFDECVTGNGILRYLATDGNLAPWINPVFRGALHMTCGPDNWRGSLDHVIGNYDRICCSRGVPGSWFCVEFAVLVQPFAYSLRHGWSSGDGALRNWDLLASSDGIEWVQIMVHTDDPSLSREAYAQCTWEIPQQLDSGEPVPAARFFKVRMRGPHWGGRYYLYCSGFELYGKVTGQPDVDTSGWGDRIF
eukprot:2202061-Rhodomonas_salina.1